MKRIVSVLVGLCLFGFSTIPALADVPALPHAFYGRVEINDNPATIGTTVKAIVTGVTTGIEGNPITVTVAGEYGGPGGLDPKLVVQGDIEEGAIITFFVNGESTGQTAEWHTGEITELDLSVTIAVPPPSGDGGAPPPTYYTDTDLFGTQASFRISSDGEILQTITATSADGNLTITISAGTIALDKYGNPLPTLTTAVDPSPPDPPEDAHIIGLAYAFGPAGATFDPAIKLEYTYDPADIPEGITEEDLVLAYYDEEAGEWVALPCTVDPVTNTITASISHFTTFAIIGTVTPLPPAPAAFTVSSLDISPVRVNVGETVAISLVVTNTGGKSGNYTVTLEINAVTEADETVTIAAGDRQEVSFNVTKEAAGIYTVAVAQLSGSFTVVAPLAPAAFSLSNLSVLPLKVEPNEAVTITVSVTNTGGTQGSYTLVLRINGVPEADRTVTIDAGDSQEVSFSVTKEDTGIYTVVVAQLAGIFTVEAPAKPPTNWPVVGGIIAGVIVVGLLIFFVVRWRRAY